MARPKRLFRESKVRRDQFDRYVTQLKSRKGLSQVQAVATVVGWVRFQLGLARPKRSLLSKLAG